MSYRSIKIDKVTLENAALVDQAAGELQGQADTLAQTVKVFKLNAARADVARLFEKIQEAKKTIPV